MERRHECRSSRTTARAILLPSAIFFGARVRVGTSQDVPAGARRRMPPGLRSLERERGDAPGSASADAVPRNRVDFLYTFGSPSVAGPHVSNPGNKCVPGIRAYTEDVTSGRDCEWWQVWCDEEDRVTNTDFAAQLNVDDYPHPKISTLVLRYRDDAVVEHIYEECDDSENVGRYDYQYWPGTDQPAGMMPGLSVHDLGVHYKSRLVEVPPSTRGPLLEYIPVSMCGSKTSYSELDACFSRHGLAPEWKPLAYMTHSTDFGWVGDDEDVVFVLKNDSDRDNRRRCIISFAAASNAVGDHMKFLFDNSRKAGYCGRYGVHSGVSDELWQITHDDQYSEIIKPALETCHEVTCVGFSLGGSLCDIFTMCANQGENNLDRADGEEMYDDYNSLAWTRAAVPSQEVSNDKEGETWRI